MPERSSKTGKYEREDFTREEWRNFKCYNSVYHWIIDVVKAIKSNGPIHAKYGVELVGLALSEIIGEIRKGKYDEYQPYQPFTRSEWATNQVPDEETMPERLNWCLLRIWADPEFWKLLRTSKTPEAAMDGINDYLNEYYFLDLPFPPMVWFKLVKRPKQRDLLFALMPMAAYRYFLREPCGDDIYPYLLNQELPDESLAAILKSYCHEPQVDHRPGIATRGLSKGTLLALKSAASKFHEDISWIIENPNRFVAARAPVPRHRPRDPETVNDLERMVILLRNTPDLSDSALARQHFGQVVSDNHRKLAKKAKDLAFYREGIPVKRFKRKGEK